MSDSTQSTGVIHHRCPRCDESIFFDEENQICDKCEWGLDEGDSDGTEQITFAAGFATPIFDGEKTATVRYGGYESVQVGDSLKAVTPNGNRFADLRVTRTASVNAVEAHDVLELVGAEYPSESPEDVIDSLNEYYGGEVSPGTTVRVVVFEVIST